MAHLLWLVDDTEHDLVAVVQTYRVLEAQFLGGWSGRGGGRLHATVAEQVLEAVGVEVAAAHGGDGRHRRGLSAGRRRLEVVAAAGRLEVARVCAPELAAGRAQVAVAERYGAYVELSLLGALLQLDARGSIEERPLGGGNDLKRLIVELDWRKAHSSLPSVSASCGGFQGSLLLTLYQLGALSLD